MNDSPRITDASDPGRGGTRLLLLMSIFVAAMCGLVYELIAGTLSSYLLGDSVTQFSLVIGLFLFAMGLGAYLSRWVTSDLLGRFIELEIWIGLLGGITAVVAFAAFAYTEFYVPILAAFITLEGTLIGMELPIMVRILTKHDDIRLSVSNLFAADYIGALAAALAFPFLLLPQMGLVNAGVVMGLVNVLVGGVLLVWARKRTGRRMLRQTCLASTAGLALGLLFVCSNPLVASLESRLYQDEIIYAQDTAYQRVVITKWRGDTRLFLNGHLQFSSIDEYRYHESLVHPAMGLVASPSRVLVLGGGDGLAAREICKYKTVDQIKVVDLDPKITSLFTDHPLLRELNHRSLRDPRVEIRNEDAFTFLQQHRGIYDVVIIDLPDPADDTLAKLYSLPFYELAKKRLAPGGVLVTQATSPFRSREAFWCIVHTMEKAFANQQQPQWRVHPYHAVVPTFGTWGFVLASPVDEDPRAAKLQVPTRFLTEESLASLFVLPRDISELETPVSRLLSPTVARLYRKGYHAYLQ